MAAKEIPIAGYVSKLLNRVEVAQDTMAFHFEKPMGFDFKPGQSVDLTLMNDALGVGGIESIFSQFTRVLLFVGDDACAHNLLQKGRPFIMR